MEAVEEKVEEEVEEEVPFYVLSPKAEVEVAAALEEIIKETPELKERKRKEDEEYYYSLEKRLAEDVLWFISRYEDGDVADTFMLPPDVIAAREKEILLLHDLAEDKYYVLIFSDYYDAADVEEALRRIASLLRPLRLPFPVRWLLDVLSCHSVTLELNGRRVTIIAASLH